MSARKRSNQKKNEQLGMSHSTAQHRLRKEIIFHLTKKLGENVCHQCGEDIEVIEDLSVEHIKPWLDSDNPRELFFDMENITFSHLSCNISAGRRTRSECGSYAKYKAGCRCDDCVQAQRAYHVLWKKENYCPERRRKQYLRTGR